MTQITVQNNLQGKLSASLINEAIDNLLTEVAVNAIKSEYSSEDFDVTITYTDNEEIRKLNSEFRDIDKETDVLSFPMQEFKNGFPTKSLDIEKNPETGRIYLGDVVLSVEKAAAQAKEYGHSFEREMSFLVAHSILHLLGYDHINDDERKIMEQKQEAILQSMGINR